MKPETLRRYFKQMPPLDHFPKHDSVEPFRWEDSDVVRYLMRHPDFMTNLFSQLRQSGAIVFNHATNKWSGCAYNPFDSEGSEAPGSKPNTFDYPAGFKSTRSPLTGGIWVMVLTRSDPLTPYRLV